MRMKRALRCCAVLSLVLSATGSGAQTGKPTTAISARIVSAAWRDLAGNLGRGAVPYTVMGLAIVLPFPWVVYQGWVGGIVSVDDPRGWGWRSSWPRPHNAEGTVRLLES